MLLRVSFWRVEVSGAPGIPDVVALTSKFAGRYPPPLQFMLFHEIWVFLWEREINVSLLLDCQLALLTYFLPFVPPPSGAFLRHLKLGNNPYCHVNKLSCGITLWLRDKCCVIQIVNRSLTGKKYAALLLTKGWENYQWIGIYFSIDSTFSIDTKKEAKFKLDHNVRTLRIFRSFKVTGISARIEIESKNKAKRFAKML